MKQRITAVVATIMIVALSFGSISFASGTNEIPGGYVAPPTKPSDGVGAFIRSLSGMTDAEIQQALDALAVPDANAQNTVKVSSFTIAGDDPLAVDPNIVLAQYLNKPLSMDQLNKLVELMTNYYRQHDYPVAVVYMPQQEIANGKVKFALLIGKYGAITLNNSTVVADTAVLRQAYAVKSGDYITTSGLEKALLLVNDMAMANAKAEMSPGKEVGTADLKISVFPDESRKYGGNVSLDNVGSQYTGMYEAGLGLYTNNLTANADNFAVNGQLGYHPNDNAVNTWNGAASYRMPTAFLNGDFGVSVSYVNYYLGGTYWNLQAQGSSVIESLNWNYALKRSQLENQNLQVRFNVKQFNDTQGAITNSSTNSNVLEASVSLGGDSISRNWYTGLTTYNIGVTGGSWQTGGATNYLAQQNSSPAFALVSGEVYHKAYLSEQWSADVDFTGQLASCNLNPTDLFSLGGYNGVKAYAQGFAAGSQGLLGKLNVRYNIPWKPALSWWPEWQVLGFVDAGTVQIVRNAIPGVSINNQAIGDYGVGISMYSDIRLSLEVDYAWKMFYWDNNHGTTNDQGEGNNNFLVHVAYSF